ncbi:hypothetical protein [Edaphobacter aggregans]|nr:hypothetical protein [Edaphobacter aggregans]
MRIKDRNGPGMMIVSTLSTLGATGAATAEVTGAATAGVLGRADG